MSKRAIETTVTDPETLSERCDALRSDALFDDGDTVLGPISEQHYLAAVAALEQAKTHFALAAVYVMRKE